MNREIHVPLREGLEVQFPRATRPSKSPLRYHMHSPTLELGGCLFGADFASHAPSH
jgi:hypothetical protein